jgi:hypothetical protein
MNFEATVETNLPDKSGHTAYIKIGDGEFAVIHTNAPLELKPGKRYDITITPVSE